MTQGERSVSVEADVFCWLKSCSEAGKTGVVGNLRRGKPASGKTGVVGNRRLGKPTSWETGVWKKISGRQ